MEAPKKIWVTEAEAQHYEEPAIIAPYKEIQYIRADLMDELVVALEGVLPFTVVGTSDDAWNAIDRAIKALEKIKE